MAEDLYQAPQDLLRVLKAQTEEIYDDPQEICAQKAVRTDSHIYASLSYIKGDRKRSIYDDPIDPTLRRGSRTPSYATLPGIKEKRSDSKPREIEETTQQYASLSFDEATDTFDSESFRSRKGSETKYDTLRSNASQDASAMPPYAQPIKKPKAPNAPDHGGELFSCVDCDAPLELYYVKDGAVYCPDDYRKRFGVTCDYCKDYMESGGYAAGGKQFHPQCLKCVTCTKVINPIDGVFVSPQGIECDACMRAGVGDCKRCGAVLDGEIVKSALGCFHLRCFNCDGCKKTISGNHYGVGARSIFCEACHTSAAIKCGRCFMVVGGRFAKINGATFHVACISCSVCGGRILADDGSNASATLGSLLVSDAKPYHAKCMACAKCAFVFNAGDKIAKTPEGMHLCEKCV
eukprot:Opistho-2@5028